MNPLDTQYPSSYTRIVKKQCLINSIKISVIFVIASLLCFSPAMTVAGERRTMTFLPHWLPQAQFAGFYVAYEKGFYSKQGIDLKILKGGPDFPAGEMLSKKRTDFTTLFLSEAIRQRDKRIHLVNIGQLMQRSCLYPTELFAK
jgi:NitT/TauT family transport system substrate-binding protein